MTQPLDELLPHVVAQLPETYHRSASHVQPDYRDGWNACHKAMMAALSTLAAGIDFPPRVRAVIQDMAQRESSGDRGPWEDGFGQPLQHDADTALAWIAMHGQCPRPDARCSMSSACTSAGQALCNRRTAGQS